VELVFRPFSFLLGAILSVAALLVVAGVAGRTYLSRRQ
jgi:hypothetical protein